MKTKDAIAYFQGTASRGGVKLLADALGVWPAAVYAWGEDVPFVRAMQLEALTKGALKAPTLEEKIVTDREKVRGRAEAAVRAEPEGPRNPALDP